MGKEVKFGLGVIVVLLITFGVILANRLKGTSDESSTASSDEKGRGSSSAAAQTTPKDTMVGKPTLVATKPSLTGTGSGMPDTRNQWNVVSDSDAMGSTTPASQPPSYMPNASTTASAGLDSPHAGSSSYDGTSRRQMPGSAIDTTAGTGVQGAATASDPFNAPSAAGSWQSPGMDLNGATSSPVNVVGPPPSSAALSPSSDGGSTLPSGANPYRNPDSLRSLHPSGSSTLPSTPATNHSSAYPSPAPAASSYSYGPSATPVSTYGGLNLRDENGLYEVQPNDSYWKISERLYGSGAYFRALVEQNRDRVPREDRLAVGDLIAAPTVAELEQAYPDLCPKPSRREAVRNLAQAASMRSPYGSGPVYVVEKGDTLFDIARYELGKASRWSEIHALNSDILGKDYDYLVPGTRLTLPSSAAAGTPGTVTSRPGNGSIY